MKRKTVTIHPTKLLQAVRDARTPDERTRAIDECKRVLDLFHTRRWDYAVSFSPAQHMTRALTRIVSRFPSDADYEFSVDTLEEAQGCASAIERRLTEMAKKETRS